MMSQLCAKSFDMKVGYVTENSFVKHEKNVEKVMEEFFLKYFEIDLRKQIESKQEVPLSEGSQELDMFGSEDEQLSEAD